MGLPIQDGFPGVGAITNLAAVDADQHLGIGTRAPAFQTRGAYSVACATGNIAATFPANGVLFALQMSPPAPASEDGFTNITWPFSLMAIVQSVKVSAVVTSTITTAVPFDISLFIARNSAALVDLSNGGANVTPAPAEPPEAMRTSMSAWRVSPVIANTTNLGGFNTTTHDTNPIGRVQGNSGTAVGSQFFAGHNPQSLYQRDNQDHHPLILQGQTSTLNADTLLITNPFAGPATGTFSVQVQISWLEVVAY